MPREQKKKKTKEKSKSPKEKSPIESEDPKMDEDEINRLMQNAFDQANARAEQRFEERLTALREEFIQVATCTCYDMATYPGIYVYDAPGINPSALGSYGAGILYS